MSVAIQITDSDITRKFMVLVSGVGFPESARTG